MPLDQRAALGQDQRLNPLFDKLFPPALELVERMVRQRFVGKASELIDVQGAGQILGIEAPVLTFEDRCLDRPTVA
jgi:hypothetical protein